jgi:hypothetical protein
MITITCQETEALVQSWNDRAAALGYRKNTRTYAKSEMEFFVGAFCALAALGRTYPPIWNSIMMSGRSLSATLCPVSATSITAQGKE